MIAALSLHSNAKHLSSRMLALSLLNQSNTNAAILSVALSFSMGITWDCHELIVQSGMVCVGEKGAQVQRPNDRCV